MDESKKAFIAWYSERYEPIMKNCSDAFKENHKHGAWEGWKASRAAIEIELPEACSCCYSESEKEWHDSVMGELTDILSAAGIKVKE